MKTLTLKHNRFDTRYMLPLLFIPVWIIIYFNLEEWINYLLNEYPKTQLTEAIRFFLYEVPKVLLLLVLIVFGVGIIRTFFSPELTRQILGKKSLLFGNVFASMLGIVTPFCSCSAVPLFIGFVEAGVPLGVTFSFLIAAPMINEVAVVLLFTFFGWQTAAIYISTGLIIAVISGFTIGKLKLERYVEGWVYEIKSINAVTGDGKISFADRIEYGYNAVKDIV
ncbi:MAG TPA: permease, partial [Ignavibacteria bacterium]|nr:permease [Ignavibacteria bacterium]